MNRRLVPPTLALALALVGVAHAGKISHEEPMAEALQEQMVQLARKNRWDGVDQAYDQLLALKPARVRPASHVLAGVAAHLELDISTAIRRLAMAGPEGRAELAAVQRAYGKVIIKPAQRAGLRATAMPEDPRARALYEQAAREIAEAGVYQGWLPVGTYKIGDQAFAVAPSRTVRVR